MLYKDIEYDDEEMNEIIIDVYKPRNGISRLCMIKYLEVKNEKI